MTTLASPASHIGNQLQSPSDPNHGTRDLLGEIVLYSPTYSPTRVSAAFDFSTDVNIVARRCVAEVGHQLTPVAGGIITLVWLSDCNQLHIWEDDFTIADNCSTSVVLGVGIFNKIKLSVSWMVQGLPHYPLVPVTLPEGKENTPQ